MALYEWVLVAMKWVLGPRPSTLISRGYLATAVGSLWLSASTNGHRNGATSPNKCPHKATSDCGAGQWNVGVFYGKRGISGGRMAEAAPEWMICACAPEDWRLG
jgi:hypothetical protein